MDGRKSPANFLGALAVVCLLSVQHFNILGGIALGGCWLMLVVAWLRPLVYGPNALEVDDRGAAKVLGVLAVVWLMFALLFVSGILGGVTVWNASGNMLLGTAVSASWLILVMGWLIVLLFGSERDFPWLMLTGVVVCTGATLGYWYCRTYGW